MAWPSSDGSSYFAGNKLGVPGCVGGRMRFFLMGMLLTLTPSVVVMTWLLWQADDLVLDRESEKEPDLQISPDLQR